MLILTNPHLWNKTFLLKEGNEKISYDIKLKDFYSLNSKDIFKILPESKTQTSVGSIWGFENYKSLDETNG